MSEKKVHTEDQHFTSNDSDSEPQVGEIHHIHDVDELVEVPSIWQKVTAWSKTAGVETIGIQRLPEAARDPNLKPWSKSPSSLGSGDVGTVQ